jgi:hypothetical protein
VCRNFSFFLLNKALIRPTKHQIINIDNEDNKVFANPPNKDASIVELKGGA